MRLLRIGLVVLFSVSLAGWLGSHLRSADAARAAGPFTVNSVIDAVDVNPGDGVCETASGDCTLRAAVHEANVLPGEDTISVPAGLYTLTMVESYETLYGGGLFITDTLTIDGDGSNQTIIDGGGDSLQSRVFAIDRSTHVAISGLTVQNGHPGQTGSGGGVFANPHSVLTLTDVIVSDCLSYVAGGIASGGTLNLISTTLINNHSGVGGGLLVGYDGVTWITNSLIISNTATGSYAGGGGLTISGGATVTIKSSLIASNTAISGGGGIYSDGVLVIEDSAIQYNANTGIFTNGPFVLNRSTIDHNRGGGIAISSGGTTLMNSTISDNTTPWSGGGLSITSWEPVTLNNVTIADNMADSDRNGSGLGGGIYQAGHAVSLNNSIVAHNLDGGQAPDCSGTLNSQDYNLIQRPAGCTLTGVLTQTIVGRDPLLGPLQNNGGATWTRALLPGSPALDVGDDTTCGSVDQRGAPRPYDSLGYGAHCDIGAYEAQFSTLQSFLPIVLR